MNKTTAHTAKRKKIKADHYEHQRTDRHVLYRCYSIRKALLYVGITNDPQRRFDSHSTESEWWKYVEDIELQNFPSRRMLIEAEAAAIQSENPIYNVMIPKGAVPILGRSPRMRARGLWPHASNFGKVVPDDNFLLDQTLEQQLYPCVECHARAIYCEGDTVACNSCESQWTFDSWFTMTFVETHEENEDGQLTLM
jgi:predicted GIY-YIG superfamily endonuclease